MCLSVGPCLYRSLFTQCVPRKGPGEKAGQGGPGLRATRHRQTDRQTGQTDRKATRNKPPCELLQTHVESHVSHPDWPASPRPTTPARLPSTAGGTNGTSHPSFELPVTTCMSLERGPHTPTPWVLGARGTNSLLFTDRYSFHPAIKGPASPSQIYIYVRAPVRHHLLPSCLLIFLSSLLFPESVISHLFEKARERKKEREEKKRVSVISSQITNPISFVSPSLA